MSDSLFSEKELKSFQFSGYKLGEFYKTVQKENKIRGLAYRILGSLKSNKSDVFLDIILKAHMEVSKEVPRDIEKVLLSKASLKDIGYAFVTGLVSSVDKTNIDKKSTEDKVKEA